jgi:CTP synthase
MLVVRSEHFIPKDVKEKIAFNCDVDINSVIDAMDSESIYKVPLNFLYQDILEPIAKQLNLGNLKPDMNKWDSLVNKIIDPKNEISLAFVGKYLDLKESYKSLTEAIIHAGANVDCRVRINWVDSEKLEEDGVEKYLHNSDAVLVAGGFGNRGVEGKISAIKYARENKIPFLGICLGMQLAMIEFARNVVELKDANSIEFDEDTSEPIIYLIDEFIDASGDKQVRTTKSPLGGTMRLGEYECNTLEGSNLAKAYNDSTIYERHRHRYEANPRYRAILEKNGMIISGESNGLIEAVEVKNHPWFLGVQFHPEFTSRLQTPNPSILAFIKNAIKNRT